MSDAKLPRFPATYGAVMRPFKIELLPADIQHRYAEDPMFREWLDLADKTARAEKISSWTTWTEEEAAAYESGDTVQFSRLRGYTEEEIADFLHCVALISPLSVRYQDDDFCIGVLYCHSLAFNLPAVEEIHSELSRLSADQVKRAQRVHVLPHCGHTLPAAQTCEWMT